MWWLTRFPSLAGLCLLFSIVNCEKFTALRDLENILVAEHDIAHDLKDYIRNEELRLDKLKKLAEDFEEHSAEALENPVHHLANPVNAFLLIKRFTTDWDDIISNLITSNSTDIFLMHVNEKAEFFPDTDDLGGAAQALLRLQDTYKLDTTKIATGDLQGIKKSPIMTSEQCFELGRHAYNQGDYYHTLLWMQEALDRWESETEKQISKSDLLDYISFAASMQGNNKQALRYTDEFLTLEPNHVRAQNNKKYFEQMIREEEDDRRKKGDKRPVEEEELKNEMPRDEFRAYKEFPIYEALCRDEETHDNPLKHKLMCHNLYHSPIFYIAPLHEEIMFFDPFIAVYHDLITDTEIAKVKELAGPRLNRATVQNSVTGELEFANYRISKSAWLTDEMDPLIKSISRKSSTLANLTLETVEELQVVNYGIAGHYEPHYDFARPEERTTFTEETGNRIATVIYYMTDVEAGGFTVFPEIGVKLKPRKGSCALWYNLKVDLEGDYRTRHAACPVLTGTKWICNKWFHERGQEFIRPCQELPSS